MEDVIPKLSDANVEVTFREFVKPEVCAREKPNLEADLEWFAVFPWEVAPTPVQVLREHTARSAFFAWETSWSGGGGGGGVSQAESNLWETHRFWVASWFRLALARQDRIPRIRARASRALQIELIYSGE